MSKSGCKIKREANAPGSEDNEGENRPSKRQERPINHDPRLSSAENPGDGASIVKLATAFDNALGQVSWSRNHSGAPELPVQTR